MPFEKARHSLVMHSGVLFLVNSEYNPAPPKREPPTKESKQKTMNIIIKNGRKSGDVQLVMGQASAVFLLELAQVEVKNQASGATGMVAGMFAVLVAEVASALSEVKALDTAEDATDPAPTSDPAPTDPAPATDPAPTDPAPTDPATGPKARKGTNYDAIA